MVFKHFFTVMVLARCQLKHLIPSTVHAKFHQERLTFDISKLFYFLTSNSEDKFCPPTNNLKMKSWIRFAQVSTTLCFRQKTINISTKLYQYEIPRTLRQYILNKMDLCGLVPSLAEVWRLWPFLLQLIFEVLNWS